MTKTMIRKSAPGALSTVAAALMLALGPSSATADQISFDLDTGNPAISGTPGPYATVTVNRTSATTATITFDSQPGFLIGGQGTIGLNVAGPYSFSENSLTDITTTQLAGFSTPHVTCATGGSGSVCDGGTANEDGFGQFNLTLDTFDGYTDAWDMLTLNLTLTSGTWADAGSVLTENSHGAEAAAHIFVCTTTPCTVSGGASVTGYAAGNGGGRIIEIPEPASLTLVGLGLAGLAALRRRPV